MASKQQYSAECAIDAKCLPVVSFSTFGPWGEQAESVWFSASKNSEMSRWYCALFGRSVIGVF